MAHRAPSSSSIITYKWTYDVFLSFHGEDTRLGFISYLYKSLHQSGIHAFLDDEFIRTGEKITPALFRAIQESRIAIIVFSENYARSTFCLEELVKILECFKEESRLIYPVFYYVDPSELRRPRGSYAEALARLEKRFKDNRHKVRKWRFALSQVADLKGCHLKLKIANEQECITKITNEVVTRINQKPLYVTNYPVGLVSRVKEVISCLDLWSTEDTRMIGIWGGGGIGKSTIARAVYNSIADNFEGLCFLFDVRKQSKMSNGLSYLQETLLCKLVMERNYKLGGYHEGIPIIEHMLSHKKVLLILDDVDELDQLKALAGNCNWFGCGSRIIITSRNKQLLKSHGIESIYDVKQLNGEESLKLLSWYAFKKESMDFNYMEVFNRAIHYSCGFPLALEVIGSTLHGKGVNHWSSALDQFKSRPRRRVLDVLKLSYDTLEEVEKQVFLDLACYFNGEILEDVIDILQCVRAIEPKYAIDTLIDKSLIKIERGCVTMHDLIEDVGKEIVRQESPNEPGERSRLWFYQDILQVLQQDTGTNKVEAIILDLPESIEEQWSGEEFMKMKNLKMLVIRKACFSECPKYLPNSLRWLEWKGYPFKFLPYMRPTELFYLDLSHSYCELLQPFDKKFRNLSHMNLRNCKFLQQIPDLSGAFNLSELWLDDCTSLTEIHDSVGCLNKLRELSAMRCKILKILPSCLRLTSLKHLNLFSCSSLHRFPEISVMIEEMQTLDLDQTAITELPSSICNLIGLEILNVEKCPNLKHLPASICTLPHLWKLAANFCEGMSHFKMSEGEDEASLDCSAMSLKLEYLYFSNCNLSDDSLAFCLSHFINMIHLDLSFNNFTALPECIKEYHNLKYLLLDNCNQLLHIGGMPPNLEKFSAICCKSLTKLSKNKVLKQAFNFQPGKRNFILPGKKLPERLHYHGRGCSVSFWVRNMFPTTFLWILVEDDQDYVYNCEFSVQINEGTKRNIISSMGFLLSTIKTNHIYVCDMQSIISTEIPLGNEWNHVKVSVESKIAVKEIFFGVHVYNLQSNFISIRFMNPRRYIIDHNLLQKIQGQQDLEELEEDMDLVSRSTKSAESTENPVHYDQERDILNKLEPDWDLEILEVEGYRGKTFPTWLGSHSYDNLIELKLINCKNCQRIPPLGQLPALRSLIISILKSVVAVGSEFFKGHYCASSVIIPFQSLETLHFGAISGARMLESLSDEKLHIEELIVRDCSDPMPSLIPVIHMPPSVKKLIISNCENLKFVWVSSKAPRILPLQRISIYNCKFFPSLLVGLVPNLKELCIESCPEMESLSTASLRLPSRVEQLEIRYCDKLFLSCHTECWRHLPFSITKLIISTRSETLHCEGLQHLTSLRELAILDSPNLEKIEGGTVPPSLQRLLIEGCSSLRESCCKNDEEIWSKISHVPYISLNGTRLRAL